MNGWAKCAGALSIIAGLVYFIAIVLAVNDNISLGDDALAVFISNDTFETLALIAGGILAVGGLFAITSGTECKYSAAPVLGAMQIVAGIVIAVTALKDVTNISADAVEVSYLLGFLLIAAALVVLGVQKKVFSISIASLILAYCVFDLYVLGTYEGMLSVLVGVVIVVFSGAAQLIPAKAVAEGAEAVAAPVADAEIVRTPASAPVAANAPLARPEPAKEEEKLAPKAAPKAAPAAAAKEAPKAAEPAKEAAKPAPAAEPAKEEPKAAEPAPAAAVKEEPAKAEPAKEEAKPAPAAEPAKEAVAAAAAATVVAAAAAEEPKAAEPEPEAKSESDILLEQGWNTAVAKVGEDKAEEMDDYEVMATVKEADPELYSKLSDITGIVVADKAAESAPAAAVKEEPKAAEPAKEAVAAAAAATVVAAATAEEPAKEEPKTAADILLEQGWNTAVANVGEERAEEMDDYEIMAVISVVDPELYRKLSILTGIVVATNEEEPAVEVAPEEDDFDMAELGLEPDSPAGFLRRACWNKGLRCRKDYGSYYIPIAFVKNKVAVYVDGDVPDNRNDEELKSKSWIVLHFKAADITDGAVQAQVIYDAVKENTRALKKKKSKTGKAKKR